MKVLCVEDDPDIQMIVRLALSEFGGHEVIMCGSGAAAVAAVGAGRPDFILLDVMLPDMDGPGTLRALRAALPGPPVPVAFMTARAMADEVRGLPDDGVVGVITKPFDPLTLPDRVDALMRKFCGE